MSRIVTDNVSCENQIHQFFQSQRIGRLLKRSNIDKEREISPVTEFRMLFTLVFTGKNLYRTLEAGGSCGMTKGYGVSLSQLGAYALAKIPFVVELSGDPRGVEAADRHCQHG